MGPDGISGRDSSIFRYQAFKRCCQRKAIRPRYSAVGIHRSLAVVERLIRTLNDEATRRIVVPQGCAGFRRKLTSFFVWKNEHRPHTTLHGKTPNEVYFRLRAANWGPRIEPRKH
ncbi:MAG: transposase [Planctomycetes bacterium]|nr:transposase [Planctomycetota bacterium]